MKVIIAGGRDYRLTDADLRWLDGLGITYVVTGDATGADCGAAKWANARGIPCEVYKADWDRYGRRAGPIRNQRMAYHLARLHDANKAVILFPGGSGTASMRREAERTGLRVIGEYSTQGELGLDERTLLVIEE